MARVGVNDKTGNSRYSVATYHKTASADCGDLNAHSPTVESSSLPYEEKRQTLGSTH